MRTKRYSDYLTGVAALIGVQASDLGAAETGILNAFFNKAMKYIWQQTNWVDVCPYGEYRVPNNALNYPHDFEIPTWSVSGVTVTANQVPNPVDTQSNADLLLEAAGSPHGVSQGVTFNNTPTSFSIFAQPLNGRNWIQLYVNDGVTTFTGFFNLTGSGTVGTLSAGATGTISQISGLWYQCTLGFTPAATALSAGSVACYLSPDGVNTGYTGVSTKGMYLWGASLIPTQLAGASLQLISWEQAGEEPIDVVFDAWSNTPLGINPPVRLGYRPTNNGLQIINSSYGWNAPYYAQTPQAASSAANAAPLTPAYLYYRKRVPDYSGTTYSAATTYAVGAQVYFTTAAGDSDYWQCVIATNAGQSPASWPVSWKQLTIPYTFFDFAVFDSFANWLRTEGQSGKAQMMDAYAQDLMDREADRQERTLGLLEPMKVRTHLTSRPGSAR